MVFPFVLRMFPSFSNASGGFDPLGKSTNVITASKPCGGGAALPCASCRSHVNVSPALTRNVLRRGKPAVTGIKVTLSPCMSIFAITFAIRLLLSTPRGYHRGIAHTLSGASGRGGRFAEGRRRPRGRAQHDPHDVPPAVVHERYGRRVDGRAVELGLRHAAAPVLGVRHRDLVTRGSEAPGDRILRPGGRDAGIDRERRALAPEAEEALQARAVEPTGRPRVPGPAAAP